MYKVSLFIIGSRININELSSMYDDWNNPVPQNNVWFDNCISIIICRTVRLNISLNLLS